MAETPKTAAAQAEAAPPSTIMTFLAEDQQDNRIMRWAIGGAIAIHAVLLAIHFPEMVRNTRTVEQKQKVYVVQQVRFKKPPPRQEQEIPKPKAKKVPIPDPTPDEPEPIRLEEEKQPEIDVPDTDLIFDIPSGPPPSAPAGPIMVAGDVVPPEKVDTPAPVYSEIARKARVEGVVIVQAIIDKTGGVTNVKILKGLPMGLDQSAANAVKRWKFKPATLNGKPVSVYYNLTVNFKIQ